MQDQKKPLWQKTQYANLIRYVPSGTFYARIRIQGKLIRKSLETDLISVAKLRLGDLEKTERQAVESKDSAANGRMTGGQAMDILTERVGGDVSLKPRTKEYYQQRIAALTKSWPGFRELELRRITKSDCLNWAARVGAKASPTAFNHTISILRESRSWPFRGSGDGQTEQFGAVNAKSIGEFRNFGIRNPTDLDFDPGNDVAAHIPAGEIQLGG